MGQKENATHPRSAVPSDDASEDRTVSSFDEEQDQFAEILSAVGLEQEIAYFVKYYSNESCHESKDNVTPAVAYYGRLYEIFTRREQLKQRTLKARKRYHLSQPIAQSIS